MTVKFGNAGSGVSASSAGGTGGLGYTWEHPVAWTQLRKYFEKSVGEEESKKLISILESNAKSLEDFLDAAYLKANGGNVFGKANFSGEVNISGYINVPPPGVIVQWAGAITSGAPLGWLLANGAQVLISQYENLYNTLTNFGSTFPYGPNTNGSGGAGSTHFRLPNLAGRVPVGIDAGQTDFDQMGETGGAKTVTLDTTQIPSHAHGQTPHQHTQQGSFGTDGQNLDHFHPGTTASNGTHDHSIDVQGMATQSHAHSSTTLDSVAGKPNPSTGSSVATRSPINNDGGHDHVFNTGGTSNTHGHGFTLSGDTASAGGGNTTDTGGGLAHNNLQPYIVLNYIIKH
jgi:microcystin-dependent protein